MLQEAPIEQLEGGRGQAAKLQQAMEDRRGL
jgi:hypothetical protein